MAEFAIGEATEVTDSVVDFLIEPIVGAYHTLQFLGMPGRQTRSFYTRDAFAYSGHRTMELPCDGSLDCDFDFWVDLASFTRKKSRLDFLWQ